MSHKKGQSISLLDSIRLAKKQLRHEGKVLADSEVARGQRIKAPRAKAESPHDSCSSQSLFPEAREKVKEAAIFPPDTLPSSSFQDFQQGSKAPLGLAASASEALSAPQRGLEDYDASPAAAKDDAAATRSCETAKSRELHAHALEGAGVMRCPLQTGALQAEASTSSKTASAGRQTREPHGFYGQSWRLRAVEIHVLRLLKAVRLKLNSAEVHPFQHFPLQEPAFRWADDHELASQLRVFSVEKDDSSRRSFIVTTYAEFWRQYREMLPDHRQYYEIIREGYPCHLYFDLEFKTEFNREVDGEALVDLVLKLTGELLQERFQLSLHPSWVVELDSSTAAKFSRHLVIRAPAAAFRNNSHVGALVAEMLTRVASVNADEYAALLVNKDADGNKMPFIDRGVYSRNRAFRLMLSSKAGKQSWLLPTGRLAPIVSQEATFFDALICNVAPDANLLTTYEGDSQPSVHRAGMGRGGLPHMGSAAAQAGPCPYPDIEAFITSICNQGGVQGRVRSWMEWPDLRLLLLNIRDNRFCANVNRPHKSNGIFYVVDLQEAVWYQKCYDPDCQNFRSTIMPLPPPIVRWAGKAVEIAIYKKVS